MNAQQKSRTKVAALVLAGILGVSVGAIAAGLLPARPEMSERGMQVWGERLSQQAETFRRDRADEAYASRLRAVAQQRVDDAWIARLNAFADEQGLRLMSDRVADAWTARLNGLAEESWTKAP